MSKPVLKVGARELTGFSSLSGDLRRARFGSVSALEGIMGHKRIQESRGDNYQAEVSLKHRHEFPGFVLEISGRLDGLFDGDELTVEEIKTTRRDFASIDDHSRATHLAQGKLYAFILVEQKELSHIWVQVTYYNLDNGKTQINRTRFQRQELTDFFTETAEAYVAWAQKLLDYRNTRDQSLTDLVFPFGEFRGGQRRFAAEVYRAVAGKRRLFAQAPTGIGKTMGTLFPALKAMGEGKLDKVFFLTAKTMGVETVAKSLALLRDGGAEIKSLVITARDKVCLQPGCDPEQCPLAIGYYDRLKGALDALMAVQNWDRQTIEQISDAHQVCPFELAMDISPYADVLIGDVNYAFDPGARLQRFFEEKGAHLLLIDEAHNLVDRARNMFTAEISKRDTLALRRQIKTQAKEVAKALAAINRRFLDELKIMDDGEERVTREPPKDLLPTLHRFAAACETWFSSLKDEEVPQELLDYYLETRRFVRTAEYFDHRFRVISRRRGKEVRIKLYNMDPAHLLDIVLKRVRAAVFFSATLTPFNYYARLLAGNEETGLLRLSSPFPPERLGLFVHRGIPTRYRKREESKHSLARLIAQFCAARQGNYLIFFPSYAYLQMVAPLVTEAAPTLKIIVQDRGMDDAARVQFLAQFEQPDEDARVGFAVMGGAFGEGIDLVGDRLIGVLVVGVGLPGICLELDLVKAHFSAMGQDGFAFAYQYPGMNRVLQTAGRVIRHEQDRGVVCLVDERFDQPHYRDLYPQEWQPRFVDDNPSLMAGLQDFWSQESATNPNQLEPFRTPRR